MRLTIDGTFGCQGQFGLDSEKDIGTTGLEMELIDKGYRPNEGSLAWRSLAFEIFKFWNKQGKAKVRRGFSDTAVIAIFLT